MRVRVINPPEPIVMPEEIAGISSGDAKIEAIIAAVTGEIDGPSGWLGCCLGEQTLEMGLPCWGHRHLKLPFGPIIAVESVVYVDSSGAIIEVDPANWGASDEFLWFKSGWSPPSLGDDPYPVKITYRAGYNGDDPASGGTGVVPAQARQAVILSVQNLISMGAENLFLRAEEVDGVGRTEYTVSDAASGIIQRASERLLAGLRRFA